ncbi:Cht6 (predicted) [Pycnogonum litorale]
MAGYLAYSEICKEVKYYGWTKVYNKKVGPYVHGGYQWASYLDAEAVKRIAEYVMQKKLGGAFISNLEYDDFNGQCCQIKSPFVENIGRSFYQRNVTCQQHN